MPETVTVEVQVPTWANTVDVLAAIKRLPDELVDDARVVSVHPGGFR